MRGVSQYGGHHATMTLDAPMEDPIAPPLGQFMEDHGDRLIGQIEVAPAGSQTLIDFTLDCSPPEGVALEQYLRDLYAARDITVLGAGALDTIRYSGRSPEAFFRQLSKAHSREHGQLQSVRYVSHFPSFEIWLTYADGTHIYSGRRSGTYDVHFLTLGYVGEGPRYAKVFLEKAGFSMSTEEIDAIREGAIIERRDGKVVVSYGNESSDSELRAETEPETVTEVTLEDDDRLHDAIIQQDPPKVRALIARGDDIQAVDGDGATPLHYAASVRSPGIAKILLEAGARVDAKNNEGETPLHMLAGQLHREGEEATMGVLLDAGASLSARDNDGSTPLHVAAIGGHIESARLLLDRGADIQARAQQLTPLHFSAYAAKPEVTRLLIERGADVFAQKDGMNPLYVAGRANSATGARTEVVTRMLEEAMARGRQPRPTQASTRVATAGSTELNRSESDWTLDSTGKVLAGLLALMIVLAAAYFLL